MAIPTEPNAAYVHGLHQAAMFVRTFDQPLPEFDQATCKQLGKALTAMAQSAAHRLDELDFATAGGRHLAHRGSDVEAWLKRERDEYLKDTPQWRALDDVLDDYRLHADVGAPLSAPTENLGPHAEAAA